MLKSIPIAAAAAFLLCQAASAATLPGGEVNAYGTAIPIGPNGVYASTSYGKTPPLAVPAEGGTSVEYGDVGPGFLATPVAPTAAVKAYVMSMPIPSTSDGNLALGSTIPDHAPAFAVPGTQYAYTYLNGMPVLVDPDSRTIAYIFA